MKHFAKLPLNKKSIQYQSKLVDNHDGIQAFNINKMNGWKNKVAYSLKSIKRISFLRI